VAKENGCSRMESIIQPPGFIRRKSGRVIIIQVGFQRLDGGVFLFQVFEYFNGVFVTAFP
jgi:hypothetical protein